MNLTCQYQCLETFYWGFSVKNSIRYNAGMHFSTLFFDLDATLYPASSGLWEQIRLRIFRYMREEVGIPEELIPETRDKYWKTYGTTLEGLRIHHQTDPDHYLKYVHDISMMDYLEPDPELQKLLTSLPQELWIFTNADHRHAKNVLNTLGIADCFSGIVDLIAMDFQVKPRPDSYQTALKMAGESDPAHCVLFDDLIQNLLPAKKMGFTTSLVGEIGKTDGVDYYLDSIHDIQNMMPQLWSGK